jgi:8-oxo-dGTP pyrophosphatase MutT (NUDIX family)
MKKTHSAGGAVTNNEGEVLVVSQRGTWWSLPKGRIPVGETTVLQPSEGSLVRVDAVSGNFDIGNTAEGE